MGSYRLLFNSNRRIPEQQCGREIQFIYIADQRYIAGIKFNFLRKPLIAIGLRRGTSFEIKEYKQIKMGAQYKPEVEYQQLNMETLISKFTASPGKKSFLVFKQNKYVTVPTENIAFFFVKYESSTIMSFDKQEFCLNHSLDHIQNLLPEVQFFRLNRQYLINFNAIKEVEHYFARKLLVNLTVPVSDKLLITKEKVTGFLRWLDNR